MTGVEKRIGIGFAAGMLTTLVVLAVIGLIVVYTGAFNVAATEEHQSITRWAFDTTFHNSVELRAADVVAPATITPAMVAAGASAYKSMCQTAMRAAVPSGKSGRAACGQGPRT
jgi:hypothetical protein